MTVPELHALARRHGLPADQVGHLAMSACGRPLNQLGDGQRVHLAGCIRGHCGAPSFTRGDTRHVSISTPHARRKPLSDRQRHDICAAASQINWSQAMLDAWLLKTFAAPSVDVLTGGEALRAVALLEAERPLRSLPKPDGQLMLF